MTIPIPTRGILVSGSQVARNDVAKGSGELDVGSGPPDPLASFMG